MMKVNPLSCKNIGHRGASAYYPENTLIAFEKAVEMGAEMIEFDVTATKDLVPVIIHDDTLDRTTNGTGDILKKDLNEIKSLDIMITGQENFSQKIPSLEEVFEMFSNKISFNIEIKKNIMKIDYKNFLKSIVDIIIKYNSIDSILVSSYHPKIVKEIKKINPLIKTAVIYEFKYWLFRRPSSILRKSGADTFHFDKSQINPLWIRDLKKNNITANIFTVDSEIQMKKILNYAVGGIFTNRPDILKRVLSE